MLTAMNVEAQVTHVPTGAQDYRPALYGGVSAVELNATGVRRVQLDLPAAELTARIVVAYTGASRNSGINNWEVMKRRIDGDPAVVAAFNGIRDAAVGMRQALSAQDWTAASRHLNAEWDCRTKLAPGVATPEITALLAAARAGGGAPRRQGLRRRWRRLPVLPRATRSQDRRRPGAHGRRRPRARLHD